MTLKEIHDILEAEALSGNDYLSKEIRMATGCDLLSDVLAYSEAGGMLITSLTNPHVIRTAEMVDISAICFVNEKKPVISTIELAKEKNIPLLCTEFSLHESCGILFEHGLPGYIEVQNKKFISFGEFYKL